MNYKYCSGNQFIDLKKRLDLLKKNILAKFQNIEEFKRLEDDDYLNLGFRFKNQESIGGSFGIKYKDIPEQAVFDVGILKSYDTGNRRYYKRSLIETNVTIDFIENNYFSIVNKAISLYETWKKEDLTEYVKISRGKHG